MGDIKGTARGRETSADRAASDPFAELAEIFEAEIGREGLRRNAGESHRDAPSIAYDFDGDHLDAMDIEFEAAFHEALASDADGSRLTRRPDRPEPRQGQQAYQNWVAPREAMPLRGTVSSGVSLGDELEDAIRNLSAPANPRHPIVVETQSFAPDRVVEEMTRPAPSPEMDEFDRLIASELAVLSQHARYAPQTPDVDQRFMALPLSGERRAHGDEAAAESAGYEFDGSFDDMTAEPTKHRLVSRGLLMLGAGVMSLALIGGGGLYFLKHTTGLSLTGGDEALLIKADAEPYKMVPKDPGGRSIPNQNKAVYDRVANPGSEPAPTQRALLADTEEPMELPAERPPQVSDSNLPGVELGEADGLDDKVEDRIDVGPAATRTETVVLEPRKVRTMIVRPDGTLAPAPQSPASASTGGAPALIEAASHTPSAQPAPAAAPVLQPAPIEAPASSLAMAPEDVDPSQVGVPMQIADPVAVAAVAPAVPVRAQAAVVPTAKTPPPAATGGYFVQISSQPSEALARQSMQNLTSRFASVIEGRGVGIKSAEIPGKGVFYRVRVSASSKSEAAELCDRLKGAGGNCFVAR